MTETEYAVGYKLNRAVRHLKELHRKIPRFLKGKANAVIQDMESVPGYLIVKVIARKSPPPTCSALIGEVLYHTRASLDYMACELARRNQQVIDDRTEFPIFIDRDRFRNPVTGKLTPAIEKRIGLLKPVHRAIIEDEQPYQGRHGKPEDDLLWLLYRLSNFDRHQFIHLTSIITRASFHDFMPTETTARFEQVSVTYGAFESQAEVARFRILPGPTLDMQVESKVMFDVAFSEEGPGAGRPVLRTLADIGVRVGELIQRLDRMR